MGRQGEQLKQRRTSAATARLSCAIATIDTLPVYRLQYTQDCSINANLTKDSRFIFFLKLLGGTERRAHGRSHRE